MTIRPISARERAWFTEAFAVAPDEDVLAALVRSFDEGETCEGWCLVAEDDDGDLLGRAWLWQPAASPVFVRLFDLAWDSPSWRDAGRGLITACISAVKTANRQGRGILYALDDPHPGHTEPARRAELFADAGFKIVRRGRRWKWEGESRLPPRSSRLVFRSRGSVGDDLFRAAIADVSDGTRDGRLRELRERLGRAGDAAEHFRLLDALPHQDDWWQLAYDDNGAFVGLFVCGEVDIPYVAYVGVHPERRGMRYIDDLVAEALWVVTKESRAGAIGADTDAENAAIGAAFQRAGFDTFMSRTEYLLPAAAIGP